MNTDGILEEPDSTNHAPNRNGNSSAQRESLQESQPESQPEPSQPEQPQPRRQRGLIKSRFKGFSSDDEDDKPSLSSIPQQQITQASQFNNTQLAASPDPQSQLPTRKRPAPPDNHNDLVDELLPAAAAIKRRRLEARQRGEESESPPPPPTTNNSTATNSKPKDPLLDIKASLRERRAAADKARTHDEEALRQDIADVDIEGLRNLAVVEEFDIMPRRSLRSQNSHDNGNDDHTNSNGRWNPLWNGRKNFKKFRPQGSASSGNRRGGGAQGVIVPLEEVKKRDFGGGGGSAYFLENDRESALKRKRGGKDTGSQSQSQFLDSHESESLGNGTEKGKGRKERNVPKELMVSEDDDMPDFVDLEAPRRTRGKGVGDTQTQNSMVLGSGSGRSGRGKAGKRGEVVETKESDSDEDDLKFRFGKRRRVGQ